MQRRRYIELLGIGTGGTLASPVAAMDEHPDEGGGEEEPEENEDGADDGPCVADPRLGDRELVVDDSGFSRDAYAVVDVTNIGAAASGELGLGAEWYDEDGAILDDTGESLSWLDAGETWRAYIRAVGPDAEDIDDFAVGGVYETGYPAVPGNLTVAESEFDPDDEAITGVIKNDRQVDLDRLHAYGRVFDEEGRVMAGDSTSEYDFPAGRDWSFEISVWSLERPWDVADHEVVLDVETYVMSEAE